MRAFCFVMCLALCVAQDARAESHDIAFSLNEAGSVSFAVYDSNQTLLRELARGLKLDAGEHQFTWDGLDRYGRPALAGNYEWRLLRTPGFTREFLVNVGTQITWSEFDLWPGNHAGPTMLMTDAGTNLYLYSISSEGPPPLLKISADGRQKFWGAGYNGVLTGMVRLGSVLYLLSANGSLDIRRDDNGTIYFKERNLRPRVEGNAHFADLIHPDDPDARLKPELRTNVAEMHLSGGRDFLVVSYRQHDEVRFFWPKEDLIVRTNSVRVAQPGSCCVAPDGRVFVVSGQTVAQVDPETGRVQAVVTDPDLLSPAGLAYDAVNDDLLVMQHGPGMDNVRRYHVADGKLVAAYGRPGGRTYGAFNPLDWSGLYGIADDGSGGFFTLEELPRRVAHFRGREHLELVAQWIGGTQWGALCALDPADPTIAYFSPDYLHCARAKIDYATRSWTLTTLYDLPDGFSWAYGRTRHRDMFPSFGGESYWQVRHVAGQTFLVNSGRLQGGCAAVVRVDEQANRLIPVAILGGLHVDAQNPPAWWLGAMKRAGFDPETSAVEHSAFSWSDTNHDGKIEIEEIKLGSTGSTFNDAHCFIDPQWNVYYAIANRLTPSSPRPKSDNSILSDSAVWLVIPNEGTMDTPIWNWDHGRRSTAGYPEAEARFGATSATGIFHDSTGATYTVCNGGVDWNHIDFPPMTWPNNTTSTSRFQKWDAAGKLEWSVGLHTAAKDRPPGEFAQVRGILGEVRDCLIVLDACEPASVWTQDGLYAGSLCGQRANDGLPDLAYNRIYFDDNHWGLVIETPQGDVLWGGMSDNNTLIYKVNGWDHWDRQSGNIHVQQPTLAARRKGDGLQAEYFANSNLEGQPAIQRKDPDIWFGPMWGDHRQVPATGTWLTKSQLARLGEGDFSARWAGYFEPPLTEKYHFVVYTYGRSLRGTTNIVGGKIRLWVDGQLVIDEWNNVQFHKLDAWGPTRVTTSPPVDLTAARLAPIRLEYAAMGGDDAHIHLFYESDSTDLRHVPKELLYSQPR